MRFLSQTFVKLKYELAGIRKQILKSLGVINVRDITKKFLNNFSQSIVDLYSFGSKRLPKPSVLNPEVDSIDEYNERLEKIQISGTPTESSLTSEDYQNCRMSPIFSNNSQIDDKMITISEREYLSLKQFEEKSLFYEKENENLKEELKKVYLNTLQMTLAKQSSDRLVDRMKAELFVMSSAVEQSEQWPQTYRQHQRRNLTKYKQKLGSHSYFNPRNKPSFATVSTAAKSTKSMPQKSVDSIKLIEPKVEQNLYRNVYHNKKYIPIVDN